MAKRALRPLTMLLPFVFLLLFTCSAFGQMTDPCSSQESRALVMSGGGAKGAFEAGAAYHLIVHRNCDFQDFSGVSVGALNVAFLAQAQTTGKSLHNLQQRAEALVDFWQGIRGPGDVLKKRFLGKLRLFVFGIESLNDFAALRQIIARKIDVQALVSSGRAVRVGTVSFYNGTYREIKLDSDLLRPDQFLDYVYASALIPVYGKMPRIQEDKGQKNDSEYWSQFSDGGVRHATPVAGFFPVCGMKLKLLQQRLGATRLPEEQAMLCDPKRPTFPEVPPHDMVSQLFIVIASPYNPANDNLPYPECCPDPAGKRHVSNGKDILDRTLTVVLNSPYRWDLNFALVANGALRSRQRLLDWAKKTLTRSELESFEREFDDRNFPIASFNPSADPSWSNPYELGLVTPIKEYAGTYQFDPSNIREQLHAGCLAADSMMVGTFKVSSLATECDKHFPIPSSKRVSRHR